MYSARTRLPVMFCAGQMARIAKLLAAVGSNAQPVSCAQTKQLTDKKKYANMVSRFTRRNRPHPYGAVSNAQFVAFNDYVPGSLTAPNATTWNVNGDTPGRPARSRTSTAAWICP